MTDRTGHMGNTFRHLPGGRCRCRGKSVRSWRNVCALSPVFWTGRAMSDVCREFGISRKTGYKIFDRYKEDGLEALCDRSRRPVRYANQLPDAGRAADRRAQARQAALGRQQDPRAAGQEAGRRPADAGQEHDPCRARPPWPGQACPPAAPQGARERRCPTAARPTICGAPTSRASSGSATAATVTR